MNPKGYDKLWRLNNLYKIRTKERGIIPFKFNQIQGRIADQVAHRKTPTIRHITLKARQQGLSTFWILWWLDDTMFRPGTITGILAHKWESLQQLTAIIDIALSHFNGPAGKAIRLDEDNKMRRTFSGINSSIFVSLEIRSTTLHNLHISEWMLCDNRNIWATIGATSKFTNITGESTGNGIGNDGHQTYVDAKMGANEYQSAFFPWFVHKEYRLPMEGLSTIVPDRIETKLKLDQEQIHFRRQMKSKLKEAFPVEYPESEEDAFATSGVSYFDNKKINVLAKEAIALDSESPPKEKSIHYSRWEDPAPGHIYVMGADVAEGIGNDYSAFKILCCTCRAEVMSYNAHVGIDTYYKTLDLWGRKYNNALLAVERNNHGHAILLGLREDCHYPNLYKESETRKRIITDLSKPIPAPKYGWLTTAKNKTETMDLLKLAIEGDSEEDEETFQPDITIRDLNFLNQALTFQYQGIKLGGIAGKNDDLVIATAISYRMFIKQRYRTASGGIKGINIGAERESKI